MVIVTHNMQQAARVSDQTAFFNLAAQGKPGKLIEIGSTEKIFSNPGREGDRGLHHRPLRLIVARAVDGRLRAPARRFPAHATTTRRA